jgi:hypothetical protein
MATEQTLESKELRAAERLAGECAHSATSSQNMNASRAVGLKATRDQI